VNPLLFYAGPASPLPPTEIIRPGYVFGREPFGPAHGIEVPNGSDGLPKYVNWLRVPGVVSQSKDQLQYDASYIIAALGSISSLNYLINKSSIHLSAQHILDGNTVTNHGCEDGWPENVFDFIIRNGGVVSETDYPYCGIRGPCKAVEAAGVSIASWAAVEPTEEAVKYAVAFQPVVSSIYTNRNFRKYTQGFLKVPVNHGPVDHSVLLLGYDECPRRGEFWIGMNSYLAKWGMTWRHYYNIFWIPRNTVHVRGAVGVLSNVVLPLGASMVPKVKTRSESCPTCFK